VRFSCRSAGSGRSRTTYPPTGRRTTRSTTFPLAPTPYRPITPAREVSQPVRVSSRRCRSRDT